MHLLSYMFPESYVACVRDKDGITHTLKREITTGETSIYAYQELKSSTLPTHQVAIAARLTPYASYVIQDIASCMTAATLWETKDGEYYLIVPFTPFEIEGVALEDGAKAWMDIIKLRFRDECEWELTEHVPLSGRPVIKREYNTNSLVRRLLCPTIPKVVVQEMQRAPRKELARLYSGKAKSLPVDDDGNERALTPENFDKCLIDHMFMRGFTLADVFDTIWNRPDTTMRAQGRTLLNKYLRERQKHILPSVAKSTSGPQVETILSQKLRDLYYVYLDGSWRHRVDVDLRTKAQVVMDWLKEQGAVLLDFPEKKEVGFAIDGEQIEPITSDRDYQSWFLKHVSLFAPDSPRGKELTVALRAAIREDPDRKIGVSMWGKFERDTNVMHLCLDPEHRTLTTIEPAGADGKPRITQGINGEPVTLRGMQHRASAFTYVPEHEASWQVFLQHIHRGQALGVGEKGRPNYQLMSTVFNLTCLFPQHGHRPLKFHQGGHGSGKTGAAFDFAAVLYGKQDVGGGQYMHINNMLADLDAGGPMTIQDNAESKDRARFDRAYLVPASGKETSVRRLYTESDMRTFLPNGSLCITAIEGMNRPEELRRTIEFVFDRKYHRGVRLDYTTRKALLDQHADGMLSAILARFSSHVLPEYSIRYERAINWLQSECKGVLAEKADYADFLAVMLVVLESLKWDLTGDELFDARGAFKAWLADTKQHDTSGRLSSDHTLTFLAAIVTEGKKGMSKELSKSYIVGDVEVTNQGPGKYTIGPFTAGQLYNTVTQVAGQRRQNLEQKSPKALSGRLRTLAQEAMFADEGFTLSKHSTQSNRAARWLITYEEV